MEILQAIWTALTTENQNLIKIIAIPFSVIEAIITMLLFTTILNISSNVSMLRWYFGVKIKHIYLRYIYLLGIGDCLRVTPRFRIPPRHL